MKKWFEKYGKIVIISSFILILLFTANKVYKRFYYTGELVGIRGTYTYHRDNCIFVKKAGIDKIVFFTDLEVAAQSGYRECNTCKPPSNEKELAVIKQAKEEEIKKYEPWLQQYREDLKEGKIDTKKVRSIFVEDRILTGDYPFDAYFTEWLIPQWIKEGKTEKP